MSGWDGLVERAAAQVRGLDWDGIEAAYGPGAIFTPEGEAAVFERFVIPAVEKLGVVIRKYEWLPTDAEIAEMKLDEVRAWRSAIDSVKSRARDVATAYDSGRDTLDSGVEFSTAALRMNVLNTYLVAVYGVDLWLSPPIVLRAAKFDLNRGVPIEDIEQRLKEHLDAIFRACKAIVWLDDIGAFFFVPKKSAGTAGLGAVAIPAYVVIVGVIAVVLIVGMLYYMKRAADLSEASLKSSDKLCQDAQQRGDVETVRACIETYANERSATTDAMSQAASEAVRQATKWGLIGVGTLAAVYALPVLVPRVIKAGYAAKRAKTEA